MKIEFINQERGISLSLDNPYSIEDLTKWNSLIYNILKLFRDEEVSLITISPQKYSIGLELNNQQRLKRNGTEYLMNYSIVLTDEILQLIAESEEFERGLLFIIFTESLKNVFDAIDTINLVGSINLNNLKNKVIILEDDGRTLVLSYPSEKMEIAINQLLLSTALG